MFGVEKSCRTCYERAEKTQINSKLATEAIKMNDREAAANEAIREALKAIQRARELSERADYGSLVLGSLVDAQLSTQYALDTVLGRN